MAHEHTMGIASIGTPEDSGYPPQLFAGDTPPVATRDILIPDLGAIAQYGPLAYAAGAYKLLAAGDFNFLHSLQDNAEKDREMMSMAESENPDATNDDKLL